MKPTASFPLAVILALTVAAVPGWAAEPITVKTGHFDIAFEAESAFPSGWSVCSPNCGADAARTADFLDPLSATGFFRPVVPDDPDATRSLQQLRYSAELERSTGTFTVLFRSEPNPAGFVLTQRYTFSNSDRKIQVAFELPEGAAIELTNSLAFIPEQLPGLASFYGSVRPIRMTGGEQRTLDTEEPEEAAFELIAGEWSGIRNRFWAWIARPMDASIRVNINEVATNQPRVVFVPGAGSLRMEIYAGPVEWAALNAAAPELSGMLFAALWDWLRTLCFGLLILLGWLQQLVGSYGFAIILLSLSVKILMSPLTYVADRWQQDVNRIQSLLKPQLDEIKAKFKGEDAHERTLAVYREHGVHPLYTFKSLAGFLIQIPVFIAAFDMLGENFALDGTAFLWIGDLAKPDRWLGLPWAIPFFGAHLNLLPFVMTVLTLTAAWSQRDSSLSADLQQQQARRLYLMAGAFFVLLYTFPAGMVLYWTSSNLFHLIKIQALQIVARIRHSAAV